MFLIKVIKNQVIKVTKKQVENIWFTSGVPEHWHRTVSWKFLTNLNTLGVCKIAQLYCDWLKYCQTNKNDHHLPLCQCAGRKPYGLNLVDFYPRNLKNSTAVYFSDKNKEM